MKQKTNRQYLYELFIKGGRWIVFVPVLYFGIAITIYRFKHPKQTETELFKNIPKALIFKND